MTDQPSHRSLPIRRWLLLALGAILVVPLVAAVAVGLSLGGAPAEAGEIAAARLQGDVTQWEDPGWQARMTSELADLGVDFVLVDDGQEIYRTVADPILGRDGEAGPRQVRVVTVAGDASSPTAYVYADDSLGTGPPVDRRYFLVPGAALVALLVTLAGIAWFLGRTVVRPLAAASDAARRIAAGQLDVSLAPSRVREVADVNTALTRMSAELRTSLERQAALEQDRRFFIAAIAHDLRTPLFSLRGYLEGLQQGIANSPDKRAHYLAVAQEKATALERLITDLFDYSRLEYLDQAPSREPLDLGALLGQAADGLRREAEDGRVRLVVEPASTSCLVDGDEHLLMRVLQNLLDNALRHTPSGGTVRLECHAGPDGTVFSVTDSGPGIAPEDLLRLFAPLYRGDTSRNRQTGGAGLGLTIARGILLAHGGDLTAGNRDDGVRGAVFTGALPTSAAWGRAMRGNQTVISL